MQESLFGCDVKIGICADASATRIDFISENDYVRKEIRGHSTCFECLDQRDVVMHSVSKSHAASDPSAGPVREYLYFFNFKEIMTDLCHST
jgi:hypothetical protein